MQDRELELLTAFVDGELTRRERKAVLKLLHGSSEARSMLWQLRENALSLHQLPAHKLPADFAGKIMESIHQAAAASSAVPLARPVASAGRRLLPRFAMAAAVLLAVGGALFYFFGRPAETGNNTSPQMVENKKPPETTGNDNGVPKDGPIRAAVGIKPRPAGYFAFRELKEKTHLKRLSKELARPAGDRLEVTVANTDQAVHKIRSVFQNHGIRLVADGSVQASMKSGKAGEYWIFTENASPEELATLLGRIGADDNFEGVQVLAMTAEDRTILSAVMGIDAEQLQTPKEGLKLLDPIEGSNDKKPSTLPPPSQTKLPDRYGLIVAAKGPGGAQPSPQVQNFLSQRRRLQPGTVQVLLVVRQQS